MVIHYVKQPPKPTVRMERTLAAPKPKHAGGRPKSDNPKVVLNIRIDADVLARWKDSGAGWQSRMNDMLKAAKL